MMKKTAFKNIYYGLVDLEKKIIMMRLMGASYKRIEGYVKKNDCIYRSNKIRKLIDDVLHVDMKYYTESIYVKAFELLSFSESNFMKIFDEPNMTYLFLNYRIKNKGLLNVPRYLYKSEFYYDIEIENLNVSSRPESVVFWILLLDPKNKRNEGYSVKEILDFLSGKLNSSSINNYETKILDALQNENNAIKISENQFLFFDASELSNKINQFYKNISRRKGIYNIEQIFNDSKEFYLSLGIKSGLSLHDIVRKFKNQFKSDMKILPYPNILFGYSSKKEFFRSIPRKFNNLTIDEVITQLHEQGGVDKTYLCSNLKHANKPMITKDGLIKATSVEFTDKQIKILDKKLKSDYYTVEEFLRILKKAKPSASYRILESEELNRLGYRKEFNYIIRQDINDIREHIEFNILSNDFLDLKIDEELNSLKSEVINSMIKRLKIVRISDNELITAKKLRSIGIRKKDLLEFIQEIAAKIGEDSFFTLKQLIDSNEYKLIKNSSFDYRFYEELIKASDRFNEVHIDRELLYCVSKRNMTRSNFFEWWLKGVEDSIHIEDIIIGIRNEFRVSLSKNTIKNLSEEIGFYYDDTFEKIYRNKKLFLMEVFGNE